MIPSGSTFWWWLSGAQGAGWQLFIILRARDTTAPCVHNSTLHVWGPFGFFSDWILESAVFSNQWNLTALSQWWMQPPDCSETLSITTLGPRGVFFPHVTCLYIRRDASVLCVLGAVKTLNSFEDFVTMPWLGINRVERSFPGGSWGTQSCPLTRAATVNLALKGMPRAGPHPALQKNSMRGLNHHHYHHHHHHHHHHRHNIMLFTQNL